MTRNSLILIVVLSVVAILLGYNYFYKPFAKLNLPEIGQTEVEPAATPSPEDLIRSQVSKMSSGELAKELLAVAIDSDQDQTSSSSASQWVAEANPGFVILFGTQISTESARTVIDSWQPAESWLMVDHEGGSVQRLSGQGFTRLDSWAEICGSQDQTETTATLVQSAEELSELGVKIVLAPMVDLAKPSHPVFRSRVCSDQPEVVVDWAQRYISSFRLQGILPVLKHFPGIGQTKFDLHQQFDTVEVTEDQAGVYLKLLERNPDLGVLVSHVGVKNQYADWPCSLSSSCVGELTSAFPETLIISDSIDMNSVQTEDERLADDQLAIKMWQAGTQVIILGKNLDKEQLDKLIEDLSREIEADQSLAEIVQKRVEEVLIFKHNFEENNR